MTASLESSNKRRRVNAAHYPARPACEAEGVTASVSTPMNGDAPARHSAIAAARLLLPESRAQNIFTTTPGDMRVIDRRGGT